MAVPPDRGSGQGPAGRRRWRPGGPAQRCPAGRAVSRSVLARVARARSSRWPRWRSSTRPGQAPAKSAARRSISSPTAGQRGQPPLPIRAQPPRRPGGTDTDTGSGPGCGQAGRRPVNAPRRPARRRRAGPGPAVTAAIAVDQHHVHECLANRPRTCTQYRCGDYAVPGNDHRSGHDLDLQPSARKALAVTPSATAASAPAAPCAGNPACDGAGIPARSGRCGAIGSGHTSADRSPGR